MYTYITSPSPSGKFFVQNTFEEKPKVFTKQVGKAEVSVHDLQIHRIKVPWCRPVYGNWQAVFYIYCSRQTTKLFRHP